jgi:preprotein translocase subunit SecB
MYTPDSDIKFTGFRILHIDFSLNRDFNATSQYTEVHTEFKIHHELRNTALKVYLGIRFRDDAEHGPPFNLEIEAAATFKLQHYPTPDEIQPLVKQYCAAAMFPYLRETIADITRRAGFPPLHIPPVDFSRAFVQDSDHGPVPSHSLH